MSPHDREGELLQSTQRFVLGSPLFEEIDITKCLLHLKLVQLESEGQCFLSHLIPSCLCSRVEVIGLELGLTDEHRLDVGWFHLFGHGVNEAFVLGKVCIRHTY